MKSISWEQLISGSKENKNKQKTEEVKDQMECSPCVEESKKFFVVIEKQILRDLAEGILLELIETSNERLNKYQLEALRRIAKYADTLARLSD